MELNQQGDNQQGNNARKLAQEILGYLNFSSGAADPNFLKNLNELFALVVRQNDTSEPAWRALGGLLRASLARLRGEGEAFRRTEQAEAVLSLTFDHALPAYREYHQDLLFHRADEEVFQPFFIGRMCEAVMQQGSPWDEADRIVRAALARISDYIGHRPVPVLETVQNIQPYEHEWIRPIPLYVRGAGMAAGPFAELIREALSIIEKTDASILRAAMFDPAMLDELAVDPRQYDFDHPINKRPNYLFGQWDPHALDNSGRCRRFVIQQVTLDAILERINTRKDLPRKELLTEGAAVLAGTMLMGAGVGGDRPEAHDSTVTLATLVRHIAAYRDEFYEDFFGRLSPGHAKRLRVEMAELHQPLGGARQDFNQHITRCRAAQLQHVHLASIFARMGYVEAAAAHARVVPVASARMKCDTACRLASAKLLIRRGRLQEAAELAAESEGILHRAINCGAIVDPWNILGFNAQYSLFPALENSIHDHRIDELLDLVGGIFETFVQIQKEAAAAGNDRLQQEAAERLDRFADWWDQYASIEVSAIEGISGRETRQSAEHVSAALRAWNEAGTAAGDLAFWRDHVEPFNSPKAYALVIEALLEQQDPVAAMALMMQWLSRAEQIPLVEENYNFHVLAIRWLKDLFGNDEPPAEQPERRSVWIADRWKLAGKFIDYLEANAEEYWEVPQFDLAPRRPGDGKPKENGREEAEGSEKDFADEGPGGEPLEEEGPDELFSAAYENVSYRDSTDDGFDGQMQEGGFDPDDFELTTEADRIISRLAFLSTLAGLWKMAAAAVAPGDMPVEDCQDRLDSWMNQAAKNREGLLELLDVVNSFHVSEPSGSHESMLEYDRRRSIQELLVERIIATCVETADAARIVYAAIGRDEPATGMEPWEQISSEALRLLLRGDARGIQNVWYDLIELLEERPLLYVALGRGGDPRMIVASRSLQCVLRRLLAGLPRLGMLAETADLLATLHDMEVNHPVGPGAITEFDRLFRIGCKAVCRCLVDSSRKWRRGRKPGSPSVEESLIDRIEEATEALLRCWLDHSRGVRLSVLEEVSEKKPWKRLKRFIEEYGADLFTQRFMNMGNLRAILHQGVENYLEYLQQEPEPEEGQRLSDSLGGKISREEAATHLTLILDAVVDYYPEYVDYNCITTQSDHGDMLYTLLDFLRIRASYDRMAWNLEPVVLSHEVLVREGKQSAATTWRTAVGDRTRPASEELIERFDDLSKKYGMRLPSIAQRLNERFVRQLEVDRLRALVMPAIEQLRGSKVTPVSEKLPAFEELRKQITRFAKELTGSGFELPSWLEALESELNRIETDDKGGELLDLNQHVPQVRLTMQQTRRQIDDMFM